ncbi:hypothetical protein BGX34_011247 [Mortierella sp. NVP85]|nr:hypothetical protein BGX34_011247 [Mortierella sp. NVP85]
MLVLSPELTEPGALGTDPFVVAAFALGGVGGGGVGGGGVGGGSVGSVVPGGVGDDGDDDGVVGVAAVDDMDIGVLEYSSENTEQMKCYPLWAQILV